MGTTASFLRLSAIGLPVTWDHLHNKADLPSRRISWTLQYLSGEMHGKWDLLGRHENIIVLIAREVQRKPFEKSRRVECSQGIQHDNLMSSIYIDGVVEWKECGSVVKSFIQG